jgi:CheY-like chemotaxis protein
MTTRILVVENDALCRAEIQETLSDLGYEVEAYPHGAGVLRDFGPERPLPAAILLDLHTPVMSGSEFRLAMYARPWLEHVPVVLVSGDPDIALHAHALGAVGYLRKPFSIADLFDVLRACQRMGERGSDTEN